MKEISRNKNLIILALILASLLRFPSFAQNISEGYWGVKAGLNINKVSKIELDNKMKLGYHVGVFANFQLSDKFSLQHEILYSTKGVDLELPLNTGTYTKTFTYIDIPWGLNYHFSRNFYATAGIQPSVYAYFSKPKPDSIPYNKDNLNIIDLGYFLGAALMFENNFGFGARFTGSVFPTFDIDENTGKNYTFQVFAQYGINKKKPKSKKRRIKR